MGNDEKGAAVKFPPPLIFLLLLLAGHGVQSYWPIELGRTSGFETIGVAIILLGIFIVIRVSRIFKRAKTSIEPWKPTNTIISTGIYAYSRNPIYVATCLVPIGLGIYLRAPLIIACDLWLTGEFRIKAAF